MKRSQQGKEQSGSSSWREGQPYTCFFQGGPPAKYGGRQGKNSFPYAPSFRKRNRGGAVGHTTTSMAKATNRDYHREIWNHEHKGGSETFKFFTSKRSEETGSRCGLTVLVVEKEADQPVGGVTAVLPTQLGADLQRPMDLGNNIRVQTGVLRQPLL